MQIPVLIEPVSANTFRATTGEPLALSVEAATAEGAMCKLKELLQLKMTNGVRLTSLDIAAEPHPLARFFGRYDPNDPMIEEWREAVGEYRRQKDQEDHIQ